MSNVISAIKKYESELTYNTENALKRCLNEYLDTLKNTDDESVRNDVEIRIMDEFNVRSLMYFFPLLDDAPEISSDIDEAADYVAYSLRKKYKDWETSGFSRGIVASTVRDLQDFFDYIHDFYPMERSLQRVLTVELTDDLNSETGGTSSAWETVDDFLIKTGDETIKTLDDLNKALKECGISPIPNKVREYAEEVLKKHGCDEHSYYGVSGETTIGDLKEAYPDGMKYPYVDVANEILAISKPEKIYRAPYRMVFDMGHSVDGIDFESFDAAHNDALETLVQWMCEFTMEHKIESNDISTWTKDQIEEWDYMIYDCSVCVTKYDPDTDEYYTCWEPSYADEEEIGWVPTEEFHKLKF